ncbi:MAG: hypothetical protein GF331_11925, partial [Chitinivibrionales bacterium]|nr:hypothetical protein [Chitinivibrionales bacterium]
MVASGDDVHGSLDAARIAAQPQHGRYHQLLSAHGSRWRDDYDDSLHCRGRHRFRLGRTLHGRTRGQRHTVCGPDGHLDARRGPCGSCLGVHVGVVLRPDGRILVHAARHHRNGTGHCGHSRTGLTGLGGRGRDTDGGAGCMRDIHDTDAVRRPAVCLLGLTYATNNLGVNALTDGALRCVLRHFPDARVSLLGYGPPSEALTYRGEGGDSSIAIVNMRFSKRVFMSNNIALLMVAAAVSRIVPLAGLRARWLSRWPVLAHLSRMDIVAAGSGGDSFSDIYGMRRFIYVSLPQALALVMGCRLVLLPQTIGPFSHVASRWFARAIMRRAALVYSRDKTGVQRAAQLCGRRRSAGRVRFCYDMAFAVEPPAVPDRRFRTFSAGGARVPLVGLNVSGLLYIGGYNRSNMFGLKSAYPQLIEAIIDAILRRHDGDVLLVPHVFGATNPESDE